MKTAFTDDSWRTRVFSNLEIKGVPKDGTYIIGEVGTPQGYVMAYAQDGYSSVRMIWKGRVRTRQWERRFTMAGLVRKAAQFAREIAI